MLRCKSFSSTFLLLLSLFSCFFFFISGHLLINNQIQSKEFCKSLDLLFSTTGSCWVASLVNF